MARKRKRVGRYRYTIVDKDIIQQEEKELKKKRGKYNIYDLDGEYGIGFTDKGEQFLFDLEDYDKIKEYKWSIDEDGYVKTYWDKKTKKGKHILFHRLVMGVLDNKDFFNCQVDHIEHNKADNRKSICTLEQNIMNQPSYDKDGRKIGVRAYCGTWIAEITVKGENINLGKFSTYEEAVEARIKAEKQYRGEFAGV